jgi:eukaryotic-like serine/threonine-protein kinase
VVQPPQLINPEVPPALSQIVMRALSKDPGARGTAAQFQADIERVLRSAQVVEPPPPPRRSTAWIWILLVVVAALIALGAVWALTRDTGGDVAVPDVTGMTQKEAGTALADAGLKTGRITKVQSPDAPEGTVVAQTPAAGTKVAEGSAVDLEVAGKPQPTATPVAVPNVEGISQAEAVATLSNAGFKVVVTDAASDGVPAGDVVSQAPQAGIMASQGTTVSIVVSAGPAPTVTPSASPSP